MNYAIILSGGIGSRTKLDIPKQYYEVEGKPIIQYVIETINQCDFIEGVVIVAAQEWWQFISDTIQKIESRNEPCFFKFAKPGENRQRSVYNGLIKLARVANENDKVIIQDAVRPNTTVELYKKCISFSSDFDGAMPVLPMKDTVYFSKSGKQVEALLDREQIYAGQAPEGFWLKKYLCANEKLLPDKILDINGSTESAFLAGMKIMLIDGDENNYKITTQEDVSKFEMQKRWKMIYQ